MTSHITLPDSDCKSEFICPANWQLANSIEIGNGRKVPRIFYRKLNGVYVSIAIVDGRYRVALTERGKAAWWKYSFDTFEMAAEAAYAFLRKKGRAA
jgi:hypothetical protein